MSLLSIKNLSIKINEKIILNDFNLNLSLGEIHVIMGRNGAGKSTLASVLAGKPGYEILNGSITYKNTDLLSMPPEIRAREGIFLSFQYPLEVPGLSNQTFLKTAINEQRKHKGLDPIDALDFRDMLDTKSNFVKMDNIFLNRSLNEGFSGGEKKRNEILQMAILEPTLAVLDEIDSGLDVDALKIVADGINKIKTDKMTFLIITHYQRLLDYIQPDFIHILSNGAIVKSGDKSLATEIETQGYETFIN